MDIMQAVYSFFASTADIWYYVTFSVACLIIFLGLDDIIFDVYYWLKFIFRRKKNCPHRQIDPKDLFAEPERPIAMFIPTYHEQDVIGKMLENTLATLRYTNYHVFVGCYSNDNETQQAVANFIKENKCDNVSVLVDGQGPTTKADNLNQMYNNLAAWEKEHNKKFEIIAFHDAEDVIAPMELKVYNYYMTHFGYEMIQLPVLPLEMPKYKFVHWTYNDEFAEAHSKDIETRMFYSGLVPSAGTATAYCRKALERAFGKEDIFKSESLTEDYESALRFAIRGGKMGYLYRPANLDVRLQSYFPDTFKTAVKQRTRWNIGIIFQAWKEFGFRPAKSWKVTYFLYKDRKALLGNLVNMIAYLSFIYIALHELMEAGVFKYEIPPIVHEYTTLWYLVAISTSMMLWRMFNRFVAVTRTYGWVDGLLSILRLPVANFLNFVTTTRAFFMFRSAIKNNHPIQWDKTEHKFDGNGRTGVPLDIVQPQIGIKEWSKQKQSQQA